VRRFRRQGLDPKRSEALRQGAVRQLRVFQLMPWAGHANYAAAKSGVEMLMESIAQKLVGEKIRVNAIRPERSRPLSTWRHRRRTPPFESCLN